ncbi:MAG: permease, glycerol uptake facilitator [Ilumatobacteraceae bacterium]|nr:permease, glycerol uptake facilitator [Ilumatobacteraceae bacterium]
MQNNARILGAEAFGTAVLMMGGPGTAILMPASDIKVPTVALAFGLSLLVMAYTIGPISGCHINPAVTLGMWMTKKVNGAHAMFAVIGQLIGAAVGGFIIWGIARGVDGYTRGSFASNGYKTHSPGGYGLGSAIIVEIVFTALLVTVVLFTTSRKYSIGFGGLVAGFTLTLIHLITIPIDNTSVNPARSFGAAIFADSKSDALNQLWVFIVFPLVGAVLGVFLWLMIDDSRLEDTLLDVKPLEAIRDAADHVIDKAVDSVTMLESEEPETAAAATQPDDRSDPTATATSQPSSAELPEPE